MKQAIDNVWWSLRLGLGLTALLAGLDKFFNILTDWVQYLSPVAQQVLPISGPTFMQVVGVIEMIVGAAILAGWTRLGGYVVAAWLVGIALNLLTTGAYFDVAVRDLVMAIGGFGLARLTEARQELAGSREGIFARSVQHPHAA